MNRTLATTLGVIVVIVGILLVFSYMPKPSNDVQKTIDTIVTPIPEVTGPAKGDPGFIGEEAAIQISEFIKNWSKTNRGSYAGFLADKAVVTKMRMALANYGTTLDFYIYTTKLHYVVRTADAFKAYCMDDLSLAVQRTDKGDDKSFRSQTNCKGLAL